jgi:hypothetical protein
MANLVSSPCTTSILCGCLAFAFLLYLTSIIDIYVLRALYRVLYEHSYQYGTFNIEGGSVKRCFRALVIIANTGYKKGYLENWAAEKSRLSSYIFPRAVEIGRRLLPIFPHLAFSRNFSDLETPIYRAPL